MANVSLVFNSSEKGGLDTKLECHLNGGQEVFIKIYNGDSEDYSSINMQCITLDKSTAIKLVKVLRTEISQISE